MKGTFWPTTIFASWPLSTVSMGEEMMLPCAMLSVAERLDCRKPLM